MATKYLSREKILFRRRPGIASANARRMAKWVAIIFFSMMTIVILAIYLEYGVPGRAWVETEERSPER